MQQIFEKTLLGATEGMPISSLPNIPVSFRIGRFDLASALIDSPTFRR